MNRGWRVPEKSLQLSALLGGWAGGMLAMQHFRHKTQKEPFRSVYFGCIGVNMLALGAGFAVLKRRPDIVQQLLTVPSKPPKQQLYQTPVKRKRRYAQ